MLDPVPSERRAQVAAALLSAFGVTAPDAPPAQISGGMSGAALFRIRVGGIAYILRLEPPASPPFGDPVRAHACMQSAADACLAPSVRFADPATGVVIMDLVPEQPLADYRAGRQAMVVELAQAVRLLHATPAFPPAVDYLTGMDEIVRWFRGAGLSSPEAEELVARFERFRETYRTPPADLVSSHNDLNARNVLYDGRRLWLIDWDAAFLADRYVDLAAAANWFCRGPAEEDLLLRTYFLAEPTEARRSRLFVMRQVNYLFYGLMFALSGAAAATPGAADPSRAQPHAVLRDELAAGRLDLWQAANRLAYGAALLREALAGFRSTDFADRLAAAA
ncbi:phosphotransferase [Phenylobacterium sp.]|jgi:aminoglycoside phosphotransferase (APT) family kinase protein|uniref:phosphotransferase n=1 Tax=Phenylobacterium sp. TaxID=1871053 RepID=UPI002F95CCA3